MKGSSRTVRVFDVILFEGKQEAIATDAMDHAYSATVQADRKRVQGLWIKIHRGLLYRTRTRLRLPHKVASLLTPAPSVLG